MPKIARLSIARARFEPEAVFEHPDELVEEILLTRGQKLAALRRWRQTLEDRIRAAAEGMGPPRPEESLRDMATIAAIIDAEARLKEVKAA